MIIVFIALFTVLTFYGFMFINKRETRWLIGTGSMLLLAASVFLLTLHIQSDLGLKKVTSLKESPVYTAGDTKAPYSILINEDLGKETGNHLLIFRTSESQKNPQPFFVPDQTKIGTAAQTTGTYKLVAGDKASMEIRQTKKVFSSAFWSFLFGLGGEQDEVVKSRSIISVPKDTWLVLTQAQVKILATKGATLEAQMEDQIKANPQAASQLEQLKTSNPKEYAKLQVSQIKQLLGLTE